MTVLTVLRDVTVGSWLTAGLILLARLIFGRVLTARARYSLWLLLVLRLCLPVTPGSPQSLMNYVPPSGPALTEPAQLPAALDENATEQAVPDGPTAEPGPRSVDWRAILIWVWVAGAVAVLLVYLALYRVTGRRLAALPDCADEDTRLEFLRLRQRCGVSDRIRLASGEAGMLGGLLRPTLVIPVECRGGDAAPILLHELMHYKYGDMWLHLLFRLLTAVYWFNPAVWICFHLARRDSEWACDQRVLETGLVSAYDYAGTLYAEGLSKSGLLPRTTFGGHGLKGRIRAISRFRRRRRWAVTVTGVLLGVLAALITACGVLSAEEHSEPDSIPEQSQLYRLTGYSDVDDYVDALQPELGHFGWTFQEHVDAGYLREEDGHWENQTNGYSDFVTHRELLGETVELTYVFSVTLFTQETTWRQVLTEIHVEVPGDRSVQEMGEQLLEYWTALDRANTFLNGSYRSPVTVGDYLDSSHWDRVGELGVADGMIEREEQGYAYLNGWSFASLGYWPSRNSWQFNGTGMALYLTRGDYE